MRDNPAEKLRVFVSSTITECAEERRIAKKPIASLNHEPILFEHIGARSVPPREVYLSRLDTSHIFVGIYRNSYGWVAPGAALSGIEDEIRRAKQRGMPRLIYVLESQKNRDPRLASLLTEAKDEVTLWKFRTADELYERIREDIEAEITRRFHEAERLESIVRTDAAAAVSGLFPVADLLLPRHKLEQELLERLSTEHVIQISGELGIGKTVFLASVAKQNSFLFVSGAQLSKHELASVLANTLAAVNGTPARYFADISTAYAALSESWLATDRFTLIIDDCNDPEFIATLLKNVGGPTSNKRLIYSMRNANTKYGHELFIVPPLSLVEVDQFMANYGDDLSAETIKQIHIKSGGNPLYLLYFAHAEDTTAQRTLFEYELAAWRSHTAFARELISYLAIANQRISLTELLDLAGRGAELVEDFTDAIQSARVFVAEFVDGYTLRHEHQRGTILKQIASSPNKFAYYARWVAALLSKRGDHVQAYFVLRSADNTAAEKISRSALFEAQRHSDFRAQVTILDDVLDKARQRSDAHDLMMLLLSKAQALQYVGRGSETHAVLEEATKLASSNSDPFLKLRAREAETVYAAATTLDIRSLENIKQLEREFLDLGDIWSAARLTTELSVLFTRAKRFQESLAAAERGLAIFEQLEDSYGIAISRLNMATALGAIPGKEDEAAALISSLKQQQEKGGTRRERAWLCNYMVRSLRRKGQFSEALQYGNEAVQIAEELGDLHLAASNRINVGNVCRDMREWNKALIEYSAAGELARRVGDKSSESSAARLAATVYRQQDNNRVALEHAEFAARLVEGTIASSEFADALEEVGDCHYQSRNWFDAATSYAKAAAASQELQEKSRLTVESLSTCVDKGLDVPQYLICLDLAYGSLQTSVNSSTEALFLRIRDMLDTVHINYAIRLFGLHLREMFSALQAPAARFLFRRVLDELLSRTTHSDAWKLLFPAMPLLLSIPHTTSSLPDLTDLLDQMQDRIRGLHFKQTTGGCSWVLALKLRETVILTITSLDDRVDTFIAATLLAFFFKGFEQSIAEMFSVPKIPRRELDIYIGNIESMPDDMQSYFPNSVETCAVTRPDPSIHRDKAMPTFVVCSADLSKQWEIGTGSASAAQLLIAKVLIEVLYQLLNGELDSEVIEPKIIEIARRTIS
jgi:tetratricopeptide (TPR) repeat protein